MERDGVRMARAKTTALTKKIDDMLDSWVEYDEFKGDDDDDEREWVRVR